jgi:hypothetical protein
MKNILLLLLLFICANLQGQVLQTKAEYYNADNKLYKFEEKYFDNKDSSILYVANYYDGAHCIKLTQQKINETNLFIEEYYSVVVDSNLAMKISLADELKLFPTDNETTYFWLKKTYIGDSASYAVIFDTVVKSIISNREILDVASAIRNAVLIDRLNCVTKLDLSKMVLEETQKFYYKNNVLIKEESLGVNNHLYEVCNCINKANSMKCKSYSLNNKTHTKVLNAKWNKDTSIIDWIQRGYKFKEYITKDSTNKVRSKSYENGTLSSVIEYIQKEDDLRSSIKSAINGEIIYSIDLFYFDQYKMLKKIEGENEYNWEYVFDNNNKIIEQKEFYNKKLSRTIKYTY